MTESLRLSDNSLQCYATAAYPCSYLAGRIARSEVVAPSQAVNADNYTSLIQHGFRRSGSFIYRPHCDHCQACISIRLPVADFKPTRSQRRAYQRHADLTTTMIEPVFSPEHYALYIRYQRARHTGGGMDVDDADQYADFLITTGVKTFMVEFRAPSAVPREGELQMVSIIDRVDDALSAVYTFFEPQPGQSFGTFNVLWQIELAKTLGLKYVYLGYWIEACKKMTYKSHFNPHELLVGGQWKRTLT